MMIIQNQQVLNGGLDPGGILGFLVDNLANKMDKVILLGQQMRPEG